MAELVKQWNDGGSLTATYEGSGDGSAVFSSDANEGIDRQMSVFFKGAGLTIEREVTQVGLREEIMTADGLIFKASDGYFGVLKEIKPYTELEYIESTGTQYIDTGVNINTSTDEVELVIQGVTTTVYKWFFGEHDNAARFGLGSGDGAGKRNVAYGSTTYKVSDAKIYDTQHAFVANLNGVFLDGAKVANYSSFVSTSTIYLFHLNLNNQSSYMGASRIWSYKHTRSGELLVDLIPVLDTNGVVCMYDKVSGEFFYNQGTGDFIAGYKE